MCGGGGRGYLNGCPLNGLAFSDVLLSIVNTLVSTFHCDVNNIFHTVNIRVYMLSVSEMRSYFVCCAVLVVLAVPIICYTPAELQEMLNEGLRDMQSETIDSPVVVEKGSVPTWLSGTNHILKFIIACIVN